MSAENPTNHPPVPWQDDDEIDLLDLLIVFARNKFFIIGTAFLFALTAVGATFFMTPAYKAETIFLPATMDQTARNPAGFVVQVAKSTPVLSKIVESYDLQNTWQTESLLKAVKALSESTSLRSDRDTALVTMVVEVSDPVLAADLANSLLNETQKQLLILHQGQINLLETEIKELQGKFTEAESALSQIIESAPINMEERKELADAKKMGGDFSSETIRKLPDGGSSYLNALRELKTNETLYFSLISQYSKVLEQEPITLQILEKASVPEQRSKPRKTLIVLMSGFLGGFIGIFGAFIREFARNAKKDPERKAKLEELSAAMRIFGGKK